MRQRWPVGRCSSREPGTAEIDAALASSHARTIGGSTHRLSLQPGLLSEAADWMDRQRACGGACST